MIYATYLVETQQPDSLQSMMPEWQVEQIEMLESVDTPSLTGNYLQKDQFQRAVVKVSIPEERIAGDFFALHAALLGEIFEFTHYGIHPHSGLRLLDIDLPKPLVERYPGPQFGVEGTRRLTDVYDFPIIGTIIKPSVGLTPEQTADMVRELAEAGIDFVKDDELMTSPPYSTLEKRVETVMRVINDYADKTGKKVMYAFNISHDHIETMLRNHDTVLKAGGTCVMVNINHIGFAGVMHIRRHSQLPLHGHRNGWGMLVRAPLQGIEFAAYQKLWRLVGIDHLHVNGIRNKFWEPDESVVRSVKACLTPMVHPDDRLMPVFSSGQWSGQAPDAYRLTETTDVMYLGGGGIQGHSGGARAGVASLRQAWEAAVQGIALEDYATEHVELRQALERFGKRVKE